MGHHIAAVVLLGHLDQTRAAEFDVRARPLSDRLTLVALDADMVDAWAERLDLPGALSSRPLLDVRAVHGVIRRVAVDDPPTFAVIETEYFGGVGDQSAVVYRGEAVVMPAEVGTIGPINRALRHLGVRRGPLRDEFTSVGLDRFRDLDDLLHSGGD